MYKSLIEGVFTVGATIHSESLCISLGDDAVFVILSEGRERLNNQHDELHDGK
jgi:hypothetical protein